jgi:hypothetical protein
MVAPFLLEISLFQILHSTTSGGGCAKKIGEFCVGQSMIDRATRAKIMSHIGVHLIVYA